MTSASILWTVGHSIRPIEEFLALLDGFTIDQLIDIRTIPRSRHNPQFNSDSLAVSARTAGLSYLEMPSLGGLRKPRKDSLNTGWRNSSFRGYADYMQTQEFQQAIEVLEGYATARRTAIMCAEAVPWRCHRSLVADALLVRSWTVRHIMSRAKAEEHRLTSFAVQDGETLWYPGPATPMPFLY